MSSNHLPIDERIKAGKKVEQKIIAILNRERPVVCHTIYDRWLAAKNDEDIHDKIDAWAYSGINPNPKSVQIKFRETGSDLGIALVRPFDDINAFRRGWQNGQVSFDRDFVNTPHFYVCLSGSTLMVVEGGKIRTASNMMLAKFAEVGEFTSGRGFRWPKYRGAELRYVTDKGAGYSHNQGKLICYFEPSFVTMAGGYVKTI